MKAKSILSWAIVLAVVLAECRKEEMLPLYSDCPLCEKVAGSYDLILVETTDSRYRPQAVDYNPVKPIARGNITLSEFGEFRRMLDIFSVDTVHGSKAILNHYERSFLFEPLNDTVIRIWYKQSGRDYYTYAIIRDSLLIHETGYQKWMTYKKRNN